MQDQDPDNSPDASTTSMEALRRYVQKSGLKFTKQRELIAEVFFRTQGHLTAEELLERVRQQDSQVSLATVYRTMKLLTDCGLANPHHFGERQTVYEPADRDDDHHDHIICRDCGKIFEFMDDQIERLQDEIAERHQIKLTTHRMELYGECLRENCEYRASQAER